MKNNQKDKPHDIWRSFRKIHRSMSLFFFIIFLFISVTGILLGWKKHSSEILMPATYTGSSTDLSEWLSVDSLHIIACQILHDSVSAELSPALDRIDIRNEKGIVKFIFSDHNMEIQLDGATGKTLNIGRRPSDKIETIHDGSLIDSFIGTSNGQVKLIYTTIAGLGLLIFTSTGIALWFRPGKKKKKKKLV